MRKSGHRRNQNYDQKLICPSLTRRPSRLYTKTKTFVTFPEQDYCALSKRSHATDASCLTHVNIYCNYHSYILIKAITFICQQKDELVKVLPIEIITLGIQCCVTRVVAIHFTINFTWEMLQNLRTAHAYGRLTFAHNKVSMLCEVCVSCDTANKIYVVCLC